MTLKSYVNRIVCRNKSLNILTEQFFAFPNVRDLFSHFYPFLIAPEEEPETRPVWDPVCVSNPESVRETDSGAGVSTDSKFLASDDPKSIISTTSSGSRII